MRSARFHAGELLPGVGEAVGLRAQCAALREDVQVEWVDVEPGAAARGSGLGDAQAPARHARQAASVEGALLGLDGGHKHEAQ